MEQFHILEQLLDGSLLFRVFQNHDLFLELFSNCHIHFTLISHFLLNYEQILRPCRWFQWFLYTQNSTLYRLLRHSEVTQIF